MAKINSIEEIETGDKITITKNGDVLADGVEVTEIGTEGFTGLPVPETETEIEGFADLHDLLCEALGDGSGLAHLYEVRAE